MNLENNLQQLLNQLDKIQYETLHIDDILEQRESDPFDQEWMRVYQIIEELKKDKRVDNTTKIRKKVFLLVYQLSDCEELAGYISDDFGLIADSKMLQYSDEWLEKLISCYEKAIIPCGELQE